MLCFRLITAMNSSMQQTLFVQNPRPTLQETLDFVDNQVMVENMTNKQTKRKPDTVYNIPEVEKQSEFKCWTCNGSHKRDACTADKRTLRCNKCDMVGHLTEACRCRSRRSSPTSARRGRSSRVRRSTSASSSTSSSSSTSRERRRRRRKRKEDKKRKSRERESKKSTRRRASSASNSSVSGSQSRGRSSTREIKHRAGRTPKLTRKKRDTVNNITDAVSNISDHKVSMRATQG